MKNDFSSFWLALRDTLIIGAVILSISIFFALWLNSSNQEEINSCQAKALQLLNNQSSESSSFLYPELDSKCSGYTLKMVNSGFHWNCQITTDNSLFCVSTGYAKEIK